jgi:mono/diheme cytochrome c family protein
MAAILFLAFWVLLGLTIFFVAVRGGPRGARESLHGQTRRGNKFALIAFFVVYVAFGIAVPMLVLTGNDDSTDVASEGLTLTTREEDGRALFGGYCNQCHTLKAANTVGRVGPNLDELRPNYALVVNAVRNGRQQGNGTMPAGLVQGADVQNVACFVDRATHPNDAPPKECKGAEKTSGSGGPAGPNSTGSGQNNSGSNSQESGSSSGS